MTLFSDGSWNKFNQSYLKWTGFENSEEIFEGIWAQFGH